nr:MAG TPA: hypothetical protein [Caudoviricetes sp.]
MKHNPVCDPAPVPASLFLSFRSPCPTTEAGSWAGDALPMPRGGKRAQAPPVAVDMPPKVQRDKAGLCGGAAGDR